MRRKPRLTRRRRCCWLKPPPTRLRRPRLTDEAVRQPATRPARLQTSAIAGQQLYPGGRAQVGHWVNPLAYEPEQGKPDTSFRWWAGSGSRGE